MFEAEAGAEAKALRPRPKPRPKFWPRGHFGLEDLTSLVKFSPSRMPPAARLLTGTIDEGTDHISPVLRQLHWLPVHRRVDYQYDLNNRIYHTYTVTLLVLISGQLP